MRRQAPDKDLSHMRIAIVIDGATDSRDTTDLAAALTRLHHDVTVHNGEHRGEDAIARLTEQWRRVRPAVVHSRSRIAGMAAVVAARAARIPVVHSVRSVDGAPAGTVERDIALRADRVIASSTAELTELTVGAVPRDRISVVPHGIDVEHFTPDGKRLPTGQRHRLVAVGDMTTSSGFATAVAALPGLPDTELIIAGRPPRGAHARKLHYYAQHLEVSDRLQFPGPMTRDTLPPLLRSAHLVICTPWRPRFGITALEAGACGVAVVASDTGGLTDTIVHRITGLLVPPRQPRALAAAVWELLCHPVIRAQYGAAARVRVRDRYCWNQIAADTLDAYRLAGVADPATPERDADDHRTPTGVR
jgi:glycosyltransferase involved in cell wall biosynthesis